jgi:hypothetical protein
LIFRWVGWLFERQHNQFGNESLDVLKGIRITVLDQGNDEKGLDQEANSAILIFLYAVAIGCVAAWYFGK